MRVLLVAIALTGAAANDCADYPCKCDCDNLAKAKQEDGVCIKLGKEETMGLRPNVGKDLCCPREEDDEGKPGDCILPRPTGGKPLYYCCVDSENRPVSPPPDFVVPNQMEAWFAMTDAFGCDPCESAPDNKPCLIYETTEEPEVKFINRPNKKQCDPSKFSDTRTLVTYFCGDGGPPKGESCTPKKTYSYNFETMQPTRSPTPQG